MEYCNSNFQINHSNLEALNEINDYVSLKLKTGESVVFPKKKIHNFSIVKEQFHDWAVKYHLAKNIGLIGDGNKILNKTARYILKNHI